jgi:ornithine carbamoyltransferase
MKDFIAISDYSPSEIQALLDLAVRLKLEWQAGGTPPLLKGKVSGIIFQNPILRTRVSIDTAMRQLGGDALYLSSNEIGLGKPEAISEIVRVLNGYVDLLMVRSFDHKDVVELARYLAVPVINDLSDYNQPCQGMADALTIYEKFGGLRGLNVAFVGDGNNVAVSLMHVCAKLGANFAIASPKGYELKPEPVELARGFAMDSGSQIQLMSDPYAAASSAHVIYTGTWTGFGQEGTEKRDTALLPYQVNVQLVKEADPNAIVLHCPPADHAQEITGEVADGMHSMLFHQAHNRVHAEKAIVVHVLGIA